MSPQAAPGSGTDRTKAEDQGNVRLSGRRLLLARATTLGLAAAGLGVFLATIPARFHQLQTLTAGEPGRSHSFLGWYVVVLDVAVVATWRWSRRAVPSAPSCSRAGQMSAWRCSSR